MATSSPMSGFRPVPGAASQQGAPGGDETPQLSNLTSQETAPQTGPTEDDVRSAMMTKAKGIQDQVMLLAQADPVFGRIAQRINQEIMGYLTLLAKKTGKMGESQQPR